MAEPIRTCVGCRRTAPRADLVRYVVLDGVVTRDPTGTHQSRGSYVHDDPACLAEALRRGGFARSQRRRVDTSRLAADA